eukprot:Platyproteum_vivax@DN17610_c0_g1_i1.p1
MTTSEMYPNLPAAPTKEAIYELKEFNAKRKAAYAEAQQRLEAQLKQTVDECSTTTQSVNWVIRVLEQRATSELVYATALADMVGGQLAGPEGATMAAKQNKLMGKHNKGAAKTEAKDPAASPKLTAKQDK